MSLAGAPGRDGAGVGADRTHTTTPGATGAGPPAGGAGTRGGSNPPHVGSRQRRARRWARPVPLSRDAGTSSRVTCGGHRERRKCRSAAAHAGRRSVGVAGRLRAASLPPTGPRRRHGRQRLQVAGAVALRLPGGGRRRRRGPRRAAGPGPGAGRARCHPLRLHAPRVSG